MPLIDLTKSYSVIHISGRAYRVRYSLNALLCLEMTYKPLNEIIKRRVNEWSIEDVLQLTRAALCDLPENRKAVIKRDWEHIKPSIDMLGKNIDVKDLLILKAELADAIINSLPRAVVGAKNSSDEVDYMKLRAIYCDELKRPDKEFWTSNMKEIKERTDAYLEVKGYKEPVEKVQMYEG